MIHDKYRENKVFAPSSRCRFEKSRNLPPGTPSKTILIRTYVNNFSQFLQNVAFYISKSFKPSGAAINYSPRIHAIAKKIWNILRIVSGTGRHYFGKMFWTLVLVMGVLITGYNIYRQGSKFLSEKMSFFSQIFN